MARQASSWLHSDNGFSCLQGRSNIIHIGESCSYPVWSKSATSKLSLRLCFWECSESISGRLYLCFLLLHLAWRETSLVWQWNVADFAVCAVLSLSSNWSTMPAARSFSLSPRFLCTDSLCPRLLPPSSQPHLFIVVSLMYSFTVCHSLQGLCWA